MKRERVNGPGLGPRDGGEWSERAKQCWYSKQRHDMASIVVQSARVAVALLEEGRQYDLVVAVRFTSQWLDRAYCEAPPWLPPANWTALP